MSADRRPPAAPSGSYAEEVARLLWPAPWDAPYVTRRGPGGGGTHRAAYVFPSERRPRMLVPVDVPGSAEMVQRLGGPASRLMRPARHLLERSVRSRALGLVPWPVLRVPAAPGGAESVEDHLADALGHDVRIGVLLGTRRVNQKPVLQVFDRAGVLRAYAKIGHNELTTDLVRREAASLTTVGHRPRTFRVPRLLHHGRWSGLEVLVVSPLATDRDARVPPPARSAAARELALLSGTRDAALADSSWWCRTRRNASLLRDEPYGARLAAVVRAVEAASGPTTLRFGGWHGDWGAWNMGMGGGTLHVWDWERYDADVPLGFDGLHFAAQAVRPGDRQARTQERVFLDSLPVSLRPFRVPVSLHGLTLRLYLLEVGVRYVEALTHGATPALERRTSWVLSLLERLLDEPTDPPTQGRP
ncbi:hypothetical protein [Nocardioides dongkuii]|uniref:hypothetical protein n=1 Tax=Nocardioides dongkuii TaxID=2760089 RepID=UPI0015FB8CA7|nr:hypothetical protein [Nocardioides dongkuii]